MKRRIIRSDAYNWSIQEFQEGGEVIERGRFAGQAKVAKWKNPEKHYPTLADAARAMFQELIGEHPSGDPIKGADILDLITVSEAYILSYVQSLLEKQKDDTLIGILQERGYTVTNGKKGRSSYVAEDEGSTDVADSQTAD